MFPLCAVGVLACPTAARKLSYCSIHVRICDFFKVSRLPMFEPKASTYAAVHVRCTHSPIPLKSCSSFFLEKGDGEWVRVEYPRFCLFFFVFSFCGWGEIRLSIVQTF